MNVDAVKITHFSDVLCVWAYVSQIRCDELQAHFADQVEFDYRYFQVFGDVAGKMRDGWADRGGLQGYSAHVTGVIEGFPHAKVHPEVWTKNTPASSMPAHLVLCAVRLLVEAGKAGECAVNETAHAIRESFFRDCVDIAVTSKLLEVAEGAGVSASLIEPFVTDGRAHAALSTDLDFARTQDIRSSPSMLFNEGRQRLAGNVGYRIMEANVRELLEQPEGQSSWC